MGRKSKKKTHTPPPESPKRTVSLGDVVEFVKDVTGWARVHPAKDEVKLQGLLAAHTLVMLRAQGIRLTPQQIHFVLQAVTFAVTRTVSLAVEKMKEIEHSSVVLTDQDSGPPPDSAPTPDAGEAA